jgi:hypothetical protein
MSDQLNPNLEAATEIYLQQAFEIAEIFGFETRNKYVIQTKDGHQAGFAAEQQKSWWAFLGRQFLGHWRSFEIHIFDTERKEVIKAIHPFRWFFQRLEVYTPEGERIGAVQRRYGILTKSFDVEDAHGQVVMQVRSGFFKIWTFIFTKSIEGEVGRIEKKWSGALTEIFTDKDRFRISFAAPSLTLPERQLMLVAAIYCDLLYFENKGGGGNSLLDLVTGS